MNQREILKNNFGITLIALVITIIIMLILTGVTINFVTDNNGIIKKAETSVRAYEDANGVAGEWTSIASGSSIPNLVHGDKVTVKFFSTQNGVTYASNNAAEYTVEDEDAPTIDTYTIANNSVKSNESLSVTVSLNDGTSGIDFTSGKTGYVLNTTSTDISKGTTPDGTIAENGTYKVKWNADRNDAKNDDANFTDDTTENYAAWRTEVDSDKPWYNMYRDTRYENALVYRLASPNAYNDECVFDAGFGGAVSYSDPVSVSAGLRAFVCLRAGIGVTLK